MKGTPAGVVKAPLTFIKIVVHEKNTTKVFSVKRPVRKYILGYNVIKNLINNRQIYQADAPGPAADLCSVC